MNDPWIRTAVGTLWVIGTLIVASGAFAALLRMLPGLVKWRGVSALAIILALGCALLTWHLLFGRGKSL